MPLYPVHDIEIESKSDVGKVVFTVPTHLELVKKVGSGAYGCVASFKDTRTGEKIAVKKITNAFNDLIDGKRILREVKLLRTFDHDNIIRILDMFPPSSPDFEDIYLVTDLMETDLHRVIYSKQPLMEEHHCYFIHQLLRGLVYLHTANIVHRDLKPQNLLVNKNCDLKICDFGLARVLSTVEEDGMGRTDYVVTRWYRAPEVVLLASEYTKAIDVWAAGCILAECIQRRPLFPGKDYLDQIKKIIAVIGTPREDDLRWLPARSPAREFVSKCKPAPQANWPKILPEASEKAIEVIRATLRFAPSERITVQDALRLKYFESLFEEADLDHDTRVMPMDWSFDNFEPTLERLQKYIYCECAEFHPEIVERDRPRLAAKGMEKLLAKVVRPGITVPAIAPAAADLPPTPVAVPMEHLATDSRGLGGSSRSGPGHAGPSHGHGGAGASRGLAADGSLRPPAGMKPDGASPCASP